MQHYNITMESQPLDERTTEKMAWMGHYGKQKKFGGIIMRNC